MPEFPAITPSPARVHERARALTGLSPCWIRQQYAGGLYAVSHFRICSYCRCIHPADLIELLEAGASRLEITAKAEKFLFVTPNPVAGDLVHMGSIPGRVFAKDREPADLVSALLLAADPQLTFAPTIGERLAGHFERPALEPAPAMIPWPFFIEHTTERQWPEIEAAAAQGEQHALSLPGA
jgi:hypothetical protein